MLEPLSYEEEALLDILTDPIDFPEFFWKDRDGVTPYRVYDYQYEYTLDLPNKIYANARSCGKTESIIRDASILPFTPGEETLITAPQEVHLKPLMEKIIDRLNEVRLTRELFKRLTRKPDYMLVFHTRAKIFGRIPGVNGTNVHGMHVKNIKVDEAQDYLNDGWAELRECLNPGKESRFAVYGVPNGIRNTFYNLTKDKTWNHYIITAMHRMHWGEEERESRIRFYGSRRSPDYLRQILAEHGDPENPMFPHEQFTRCLDVGTKMADGRYDKHKPTITKDYVYLRILAENLNNMPLAHFLRFPESHKKYKSIWISIDWGHNIDPTEILVWSDEVREGQQKIRLISRIHAERLTDPEQVDLVNLIFAFYKNTIGVSSDATGRGGSLHQSLQLNKKLLRILDPLIMNEKVEIGEDLKTKEPIRRPTKDFAFECLQNLVMNNEIILPYDDEIVTDWLAHRERSLGSGRKEYVCDSRYKDHTLTSAACMAFQREIRRIYGLSDFKKVIVPQGFWVSKSQAPGAYGG